MAVSEPIAPRYYHGGVPNLRRGDLLLPPSLTNEPCASDYGADDVHRRDRVYVTTDLVAALMFGSLHPSRRGWVYEVAPVGELEPDPDCDAPGLSLACERAQVLTGRKITGFERRKIFKSLGVSVRLLNP